MISPLAVGAPAPDFTLAGDGDTVIRLSALRGKKVVVYFYPKDDTTGCTVEARGFSCMQQEFDAANTVVIGISGDSVQSHEKFRKKHDLTVLLGSDPENSATTAYGVWVEKSMYGRKYMGIERSTFLIGADGNLARIWNKVKVANHAAEVLEAAKAL